MASRPLVTIKTPAGSPRDIPSLSQDDDDLQWRTNLSFSPTGFSRDGLEHESNGFALYSSTSRARKSLESSFQQSLNSSASGVNEQKTCIVNNSVPRSSSSSKQQCYSEEKGTARSFLSLSSKQPFTLTHSSYPRVFCNPVSDCGNHHTQKDSSTNPESSFMMSTRNHQGSPEEQASSPNPRSSSEMLLQVERLDETQVGNPRDEPNQRCGVCNKLLFQKSPWCSYKMMRSGDKPAAGVFPCHHVYHVECLDQVTTKTQTRDPSCPVCSNTNTIEAMEQQLIVPQTLQMALSSLRRSRTAVESETLVNSCNDNQTRHVRTRIQKWKKISCCLSLLDSSRKPT